MTLTPKALYEQVAEQLRQRIFQRELEPGSWIDELKIAEQMGISRTPLREAIKVLAAEGLVTMKVRRGAYVTEMSDKDLRDVYHLLALLESDAAAVVAERATVQQLQALQTLHEQIEFNGNARGLGSGHLFSLTGFSRQDQNREYLIVNIRYYLVQESLESGAGGGSMQLNDVRTAVGEPA